MNTDNYSVYFWEQLQQNSDTFGQNIAQKMCELLEEKDFQSVRDLYKKIKELLSQENTERIFGLSDTNQLLEVHDYIDETFEILLTDNVITDQIFKDAYKKKGMQSVLLQEQGSADKIKPLQINLKRNIDKITKEKQAQDQGNKGQSNQYEIYQPKRVLKQLEKNHQKTLKDAYRPHNYAL